jgi:F-type H+-transporting ATPase subunit a
MDFLQLLEHHILDHVVAPGITVSGVRLAITKHVIMLWISGALLVVGLSLLARRWPRVPKGARGLVESFIIYVRDEVVLPNTGEVGRPYLPYFLTLFFFILTANLIGLLPGSATATGNIGVCAALSLCTVALINIAGIRKYGVAHHIHNFIPHGLPGWLVPLMLPLEIMGLFTRAFALTIRLFANMIAGHIVILAFLSLIFLLGSVFVAPISVGLSVGLMMLEIFVCFLQAYIFTLLSSIFVGASLNPH